MSKYHKLQAKFAGRDWTEDESIIEGLQAGLKLEGYGTEFKVWSGGKDGIPVDEEAVRQAIIREVTSSPMMEKYKRSLEEMADGELPIDNYDIFAKADPELIFEHGNFQRPMRLGEFEVITGAKDIERRHKRSTKKQRDNEEDAQKLRKKLDDTPGTDENHYLLHANQCGYLLRNTDVRFNSSAKNQWGTSVMTRIRGITLPELRDFIDSTGKATLSMINTHINEYTNDDDDGDTKAGIVAMHVAFAEEIVDFLNLELEVDIAGLVKQHSNKTDSAFQSIGHWIEQSGGDNGMVLRKLIERNGNVTSEKITEQFESGYESKLMA